MVILDMSILLLLLLVTVIPMSVKGSSVFKAFSHAVWSLIFSLPVRSEHGSQRGASVTGESNLEWRRWWITQGQGCEAESRQSTQDPWLPVPVVSTPLRSLDLVGHFLKQKVGGESQAALLSLEGKEGTLRSQVPRSPGPPADRRWRLP